MRAFRSATPFMKDLVFLYVLLPMYLGIFGFGGLIYAIGTRTRKRSIRVLKAAIVKKLEGGIALNARDVNTMARGTGLYRKSVTEAIAQLLLEVTDPKQHAAIQQLSIDLEKTEPFEDLPPEVKPSLLRLQELTEKTGSVSDLHILSPIQRALGSYMEQKADQEKAKKWSKWVNFMTVVGFVVGLWGFWFAWNSPSSKEMETIFRTVLAAQGAKGSTAVDAPALPASSGGH